MLAVVAASSGCDAAKAHYEALAFDAALDALQGERRSATCLEVKALVLLALDRRSEARTALKSLFAQWPAHPIDMRPLAPADRSLIRRIQRAYAPMTVRLEAGWLVHTAVRLQVQVTGGLRDARRVRFDATIGSTVSTGTAPLVGRVATTTVSVPMEPSTESQPTLILRVQVLGEGGRTVYGSEFRQTLPARPAPPPVETAAVPWWVWAVGAAVVVSAAVTTVVLVQPSDPDVSGTLGGREVP